MEKPYLVETEWNNKIAIATPLVDLWINQGDGSRILQLKTRDDRIIIMSSEDLKRPLFKSKKDFKNTLGIPNFPERYTLNYYAIKS